MQKLIIVIFLLIQSPAHSYIGPGTGGGLIVATIGVIIAILAALFAIIWFPIKILLKKKRDKKEKIKDDISS